jgi:hypothetical protein
MASSQAINELILKKLLQHYGIILTDKDPVPLFGLKLLSVIVERNQGFVAILKKLNLVQILLEYFQAGHSKFNAYTVKIVKQIVAQKDIELEQLEEANLVKKVNEIMQSVMSNHQEWCTDSLLDIMNDILHKAANLQQEKPDSPVPQSCYEKLLINFNNFIKLLGAQNQVIVEKASNNILAFIHFSSKFC